MGYAPAMRLFDSGGVLRPITPSDTNLVHNCKAIWSNDGATVSLGWPDGSSPVSLTLPAGVPVPLLGPFFVRATGTTGSVLGFFDSRY